MGIDAADVDGERLLDVYITHLEVIVELNRLYHNNSDGTFTDVTYNSGIGNKAILLSGRRGQVHRLRQRRLARHRYQGKRGRWSTM